MCRVCALREFILYILIDFDDRKYKLYTCKNKNVFMVNNIIFKRCVHVHV